MCKKLGKGIGSKMIVGFIAGTFLGTVCGVVVMALCQAAKERSDTYGI